MQDLAISFWDDQTPSRRLLVLDSHGTSSPRALIQASCIARADDEPLASLAHLLLLKVIFYFGPY